MKRYRILLDFSKVSYRSLEFNFTFLLAEPFYKYDRIFRYFQKYASKYYKFENIPKNHKPGALCTYYLSNKSIALKIYCKEIEGIEYCRIEYTLFTAEKIKSCFKTKKVNQITDEQLTDYFKKQFYKDILTPCNKMLKQQNKLIKGQIAHLENKGLNAIKTLAWQLDSEGDLLDLEQITEAVRMMDKANASRTIKRLSKEMKVDKLCGNLKRIQEIQEHIGKAVGPTLCWEPTIRTKHKRIRKSVLTDD